MSYLEWLRDLAKLPKTAEFCMMDVTERISTGNHVINFIITEAKGSDIDPNGRRGQRHDVCRPRIYVSLDKGFEDDSEAKIEITEPIADVEKAWIRHHSESLHEFYLFHAPLCESVLTSLTTKIGIISERSTALLESQLGDEVVKLVTRRLSGEAVEDASLKNLMIKQLAGAVEKHIMQPVHRVSDNDDTVETLEVEKDGLHWEYQNNGRIMQVTWKGITLIWNGSGAVLGDHEALCVRDMFLYMVILPGFGQMIAEKLAKIMENK